MTAMISASAHAEKNTTAKARHVASKVGAGIVDPGYNCKCWMRHSSPFRPDEMLATQQLIHRHAFHRILRCKRATSDEKTRFARTRNARCHARADATN